jgi:proline-specific peptidase
MSMNTVTEGFIASKEGKIYYKIIGEKTSLPPLLVLHGGPGAPHDYLEPLGKIATDRQVIFYDQLGCGKSERPKNFNGWTLDYFIDELIIVIDALDLDSFHLLGQSYGAMLAVSYHLSKEDHKIVSLILSGACLSSKRFIDDQRAHIDALPNDIKTAIIECEENKTYDDPRYQEAMMVFYQKHVCRMDPWPECLNRAMAGMGNDVYHTMWGPSEFTLTGNLASVDLTPRLKDVNVPVLLTCGAFDEATPATTDDYRKQFKDARMVIFENASHEHHLESEEAYLNILKTFLEDNDLHNR